MASEAYTKSVEESGLVLSDAETGDSDSDSDVEETTTETPSYTTAIVVQHADTRSFVWSHEGGERMEQFKVYATHALSALGTVEEVNLTWKQRGKYPYVFIWAKVDWDVSKLEGREQLMSGGTVKLGRLGRDGKSFWKVTKYVPREKTTHAPASLGSGGSDLHSMQTRRIKALEAENHRLMERIRQLEQTPVYMKETKPRRGKRQRTVPPKTPEKDIFAKMTAGDDGVPKPTKRTGNSKSSE